MGKLTVQLMREGDDTPPREQVSAVFLVAFDGDKILAARNERGWDIPGGHLDGQESFMDGLRREIDEEAGASFKDATPYAILLADWTDKVMIFYASGDFSLGEFVPKEDALERDVLEIKELINRYYGDKEMLQLLIAAGKKKIS